MPLESSAEHPQPLRVVAQAVKNWVERLGPVWVEGQLIEIRRRAGSSTHFLRLRDSVAEVSVSVTVSTAVLDSAGPLTEGATVTAWVKPSVWSTNGSLSFECRDLRPSGEGRLLAQLEQRKRMLQAEGLFAPELKRRLPFLPAAIGLITGEGSAAERDVEENVRRRWPAANFVTAYALMQGPQSATQVIAALERLDQDPRVEVIVIARGGGALEDLLPFSDEALIRAVAAARKPVVSAIGHETDNPILDLVADLRASTPTDAAKRIVPDAAEEGQRLGQARERLNRAVTALVSGELHRLELLRSRPVLVSPGGGLAVLQEQVTSLRERVTRAIRARLNEEQAALENARSRARAMSPEATLRRGYAILVGPAHETVASITSVRPGDQLQARLTDGTLTVSVQSSHPATTTENS